MKKTKDLLLLLLISFLLLPSGVSAQYCRTTGGTSLGSLLGIGPLGNFAACTGSVPLFVRVISIIIGVLTAFGSLWFIFQLFLGAINWISAGGDKQQIETARKRLTNAVVGLLIVVASYAIIAVVGAFLGIDIINFEVMIQNLAIIP